MRKFGHKIARPSLLHKPDFAGFFTAFSHDFHCFFMAFSRFFHSVTMLANLEVAPSIFQAWDIFGGGGGTFLR